MSLLPQLPRLLHTYLSRNEADERYTELEVLNKKYRKINIFLVSASILLAAASGLLLTLLLR